MENSHTEEGLTTDPVKSPEIQGVELRTTLEAWVDERPHILYKERGVRQDVANAIISDILDPLGKPDIPQSVLDYRRYVDGAIASTIEKLNKQPKDENGIIKKSQTVLFSALQLT